MSPCSAASVPSVAELPTSQKTFPPSAPFSRFTDEYPATVNALRTWNRNTAFGSPRPFSVKVPVIAAVDEKQ